MTSVQYSKLSMEDPESEPRSAFDYSSPFSYDDGNNSKWKYRSAFTYDNQSTIIQKDTTESQFVGDKLARLFVLFGFYVVYIFTFPILIWFSFKRAKENERFVVFRLGKCHGSKGPGLVFILPILDRYHKIDIHLKAFSVPPKQLITSDGAIIEVGAEIYHKVKDAEKTVKNVQDLNQSIRILVQTGLCNILCQKTLSEIESERKSIADNLLENSNKTCLSWGSEVQRVELSQIKVLNGPVAKSAPTLMMPPGLMEMATAGMRPNVEPDSGLPSAFVQLANAVMSASKGDGQILSDALSAFQCEMSPPQDSILIDMKTEQQKDGKSLTQPTTTSSTFQTPTALSTDQLLSLIQGVLDDDLVRKVTSTFQFDIEGKDGGLFYLDLSHGGGSIARGKLPTKEADVEISTTTEDLQTMLAGNLSPFHAYMSGRLRVSGDVRVALRLEDLAERLKPHLQTS